jgi:transforming growth factor-beta-induced protein
MGTSGLWSRATGDERLCRSQPATRTVATMAVLRISPVVAVLVVGLLSPACAEDGDDGDGAASPTPTVASTPDATGAPTTVTEVSDGPGEASAPHDIVGTALLAGSFSQLAGYLVDAGLVDALRGGPFTVFAPTDTAFTRIPEAVRTAVTGDEELLATVLTYHVVEGELNAADLQDGQQLMTLADVPLTVNVVDGAVFINGNQVEAADVAASNGVIHVMSDVLLPPIGDIIDVATTLPGFDTLAGLVTDADLVDTLRGEGPFTVFAPPNAAFEALPAATLSAVSDDLDLLTTVLTYHVVPGLLTTADLAEGTYTTVAGVDLVVTKADGRTFVNGIEIVVQNVLASNGIIHVIGGVLVPES